MKKLVVFMLMVFCVASLYARAIQEDYRNAEERARVSYAFGMVIGANLITAPIEFDHGAFAEGVRSIIDETVEPQFSEQEAMEIAEAALHRAMERVTDENRRIEEEFLAENAAREEVRVTQTGLQYEVINEVAGEKPNRNSIVRVNYTGVFIDGTPFDSSIEEGGAYIPLEMVIPGWSEGLQLMSPGCIYRFFIPSRLAYGREGVQGIIPPYSTLIFAVELLEIINEEAEQQ